jgi:hypothetical protein
MSDENAKQVYEYLLNYKTDGGLVPQSEKVRRILTG